MEQNTERQLALHHSCYEMTFRLFADHLTYENPALDYQKTIKTNDVAAIIIRCDGADKLRIRVRCVTRPNETFTLLDNDEGNSLLTHFVELCAACRPNIRIDGYHFDIDLQQARKRTAWMFVLSLLFLLSTAATALLRCKLPVLIAVGALAVLSLILFFLRRSNFRELLDISQGADLAYEQEKLAAVIRTGELADIADAEPQDKLALQQEECRELIRNCALLRDTVAGFSAKKIAALCVSRRVRLSLDEPVPNDLVQRWSAIAAMPVSPLPSDAFAVDAKTLYRKLKIETRLCTFGSRFPFAYVEAQLENTSDRVLDGAIQAFVRFDGTPIGSGVLLLPPGGLEPHGIAVVNTVMTLSVLPVPEKTVVWYEEYRLWRQ